jgi:hypothetical protein
VDVAKYTSPVNLPVPPHNHEDLAAVDHTHEYPRYCKVVSKYGNVVNESFYVVLAELPDNFFVGFNRSGFKCIDGASATWL